jgi:hypothetical protein
MATAYQATGSQSRTGKCWTGKWESKPSLFFIFLSNIFLSKIDAGEFCDLKTKRWPGARLTPGCSIQ